MGMNDISGLGPDKELVQERATEIQHTAAKGAITAAATAAGVTVKEYGSVINRTKFTLTNVAYAITDAGAAGAHGSLQLYDFPAGQIKVLGGALSITAAAVGTGNIDSGVTDMGVGSVTTSVADETLATTEQDIINKDDVTLSSGDGTFAIASSAIADLDGTATAIDAFLNTAITAATASADDTLTLNGTVEIVWVNLGDV